MTGSSTTTMPLGTNNPHPRGDAEKTVVAANATTTQNAADVRQGKRGSRMMYVLTASVLLLLIGYALIGVFSDTILVTDLAAPAADGTVVPGPTEAQESVIVDSQ